MITASINHTPVTQLSNNVVIFPLGILYWTLTVNIWISSKGNALIFCPAVVIL